MQSETKTTIATVRIALSFAYSTFEVSQQLENPDGITPGEIGAARINAQSLAEQALNDYKATYQSESKPGRIQRQSPLDMQAIAEVEKLPLYSDAIKNNRKAATEKPIKTKQNGGY